MSEIKNFAEYLAEQQQGVYASAILTDESKQQLYDFVDKNLNLDKKTAKEDYHTTVVYSRKPFGVKFGDVPLTPLAVLTTKATGYELFNTQDGGKCLVLKLDSPFLTSLHNAYIGAGASYDYDEYKPHITLCYNFTGELGALPLPDFDIQYDKLEIKPLDTDYKPEDK